MRRIVLLTACLPGFGLGGCATTSFAPPQLKYQTVLAYEGQQDSVSYGCPGGAAAAMPLRITRTVRGAHQMIDNYVLTYRCAAHSAANGRQMFEVPSFLVLTGAAMAAAFGAGPDVAIAATGANAVLNAGSAYYVPKEKTKVLDQALDAFVCIKAQSVGVDAFAISKEGEEQRTTKGKMFGESGYGSVGISVDEQYFDMIAAALLQTERIAGRQLRDLGTFDASSAAAEIEKIAKEKQNAAEAAKGAEGFLKGVRSEAEQAQHVQLELSKLQPALQECIWRAKVS